MAKKGRPTKFTDKHKQAIINRIKKGSKFRPACILADVSYSLFMEWKKQGIEDKEKGIKSDYVDFLDRITLAREQYISKLEKSVNKTAEEDGKFALELLSRLRPEVYGKKDRLQLSGNIDSSVDETITIRIVTNEAELKE